MCTFFIATVEKHIALSSPIFSINTQNKN
jgi:hypothetical protein